MKVNDKLYYVDISGKEYTYIITEITEDKVVVAWEEDTSIKRVFTHEQAKILWRKSATLEDALKDSEKRKGD